MGIWKGYWKHLAPEPGCDNSLLSGFDLRCAQLLLSAQIQKNDSVKQAVLGRNKAWQGATGNQCTCRKGSAEPKRVEAAQKGIAESSALASQSSASSEFIFCCMDIGNLGR
eukprot:1161476-Pelagomonas_calceolata.AAC.5